MIEALINKNIIFLQNHDVRMNSEEEKEVYKYGLQILYYYLVDLLVIFSLSCFMNRIYETAIMIFVFGLLQVFGGGYHAKKPLSCLLIMLSGVIVGVLMISIIAGYQNICIILFIISSVIILIFTPVINKKHPVGKKVYQRSRLIVRSFLFFIALVMSALIISNKMYEAAIITITFCIYTTSLASAKLSSYLSNLINE